MALSHIPAHKVKQVLNQNREFIYNATDEYAHVDMVDLSDDELLSISEIITRVVAEKEFIAGNELVEAIRQKHPETYERINAFSMVGIRDAIGYKLRNRFEFRGNIICEVGRNLSMAEVFGNYCKNRELITLDELNVLKNELNTVIYFNSVYSNSLRISQNEFVSKNKVHFFIKETDEAIERFCPNDYISINEISHFSSFPDSGFPWTIYLLEHYVAEYSEKFKLIHTTFNAENCVGAIVRKRSEYKILDDILVDALAKSGIIENSTEALDFLCNQGYLARRKLSNIDQILINAKIIKQVEGTE